MLPEMNAPKPGNNLTSLSVIDFAMFCVALIWAANNIITKITYTEMKPETFMSLRFIIASALFLLVLFWKEPGFNVRRGDWGWIVLLGIVGTSVLQPLYLKGLSLTTASNTSLIMTFAPAIVALLNRWFYGEVFNRRGWLGVGLAFLGVFLIIQNGQGFRLGGATINGDVLELAGAFFWALYTVLVTLLVRRYSPLLITALSTAIGTLPLLALGGPGALSQDWEKVTIIGWGGVVFSAAIGVVLAYLIWNISVSKIGGARTAIYQNMSPVMTVIGGALILGEGITLPKVIGAVMILGGVYIVRTAGR